MLYEYLINQRFYTLARQGEVRGWGILPISEFWAWDNGILYPSRGRKEWDLASGVGFLKSNYSIVVQKGHQKSVNDSGQTDARN